MNDDSSFKMVEFPGFFGWAKITDKSPPTATRRHKLNNARRSVHLNKHIQNITSSICTTPCRPVFKIYQQVVRTGTDAHSDAGDSKLPIISDVGDEILMTSY